MEVIFMDTAYKTTRIVDVFSSLIWYDYYIGEGEFELRFPMESNALAGIREGWYASIKESKKYMIIEGIEISTNVTDGNYAILTGRSLESILRRRVILEETILSGDFQTAILRLLNANFTATSSEGRKIPQIVLKTSDDPAITSLTVEAEYKKGENLYEIIYELCFDQKVGFRMMPDDELGCINFELYKGVDRTYAQEANPWVVFSPKFENIQSTSMVMSTANLKNYAIIESIYTTRDEDGNNVENVIRVEVGEDTGLNRREIYGTCSIRPDEVDKDSFGKPSDRVNERDYMTYEPVRFDRQGYERAMEAYNKKLSAAYVPRRGDTTRKVWKEYKPGDPGYIGDQPGVSAGDPARVNGHWVLETIPGDTVDQWKKNNARYFYIAANEEPNKEDFMIYDWVLTDEDGYNKAMAKAQADIDSEYKAAVDNAMSRARAAIESEARALIAPYLSISTFEGEVDPNVQFKFGESYYLGDLVQVVNEFNFQAVTRVVGMEFTEEEGAGIVNRPIFESDDKAVFEL